MITVREKVKASDKEMNRELDLIAESIHDKFLEIPKQKEKTRLKIAKWNPETGEITEDIQYD